MSNTVLWVEKYRPRKLEDVLQQSEVIKMLSASITTGELPHLLFYGPPGSGKTSTILALVYQLFGPKLVGDRVLELNASDDRGIGIVRNTIIKFSKVAVGTPDPNYPSPKYKVIILDEADAMTPEAQSALRKVMETMSDITRFCIICNYINQIIEPILSRCVKYKFNPISKNLLIERMSFIARNEKIEIDDTSLDTIITLSEGDARRAVMILQNAQYIYKKKKLITSDDIIEVAGGIREDILEFIWNGLKTGDIMKIRDIAIDICKNGYTIKYLLIFLLNKVINENINEIKKANILFELGTVDRKLSESADEYLQLLNILMCIGVNIKVETKC